MLRANKDGLEANLLLGTSLVLLYLKSQWVFISIFMQNTVYQASLKLAFKNCTWEKTALKKQNNSS